LIHRDEFAISADIKSIKIPHMMTPTQENLQTQITVRFKNENSLYLDIGKPEFTGRLETMATISGANSPVTIRLSNLNSCGSSIALGGHLNIESDSFQKKTVSCTRSNKTLKVSIYSNMQRLLKLLAQEENLMLCRIH